MIDFAKFRANPMRKGSLKIGDKNVVVRKITVAMWRELFDSVQAMPQLLVTVMGAPAEDRTAYFMVAAREAFDDVVRVTSVLSGIDEEYIEQNASIDELVAFYKAVAERNNFAELLKNAKGVLGLAGMAGLRKVAVQPSEDAI